MVTMTSCLARLVVVLLCATWCTLVKAQLNHHDDHSASPRRPTILQSAQSSAPSCPAEASEVLSFFVDTANRYIKSSKLLTDRSFNVFGVKDNRLDPISFGDELAAQSQGETCLEKKCLTVFGTELCSPRICAAGEACAQVKSMEGLRTLRIKQIVCLSSTMDEVNDRIIGTGLVTFSCDHLVGVVNAEASAAMNSMIVPISSTGTVTISGIRPTATVEVILSARDAGHGLKKYHLELAVVKSISIPYESIDVAIDNLGPLNSLLSSLTTALKDTLDHFLDLDGQLGQLIVAQLPNAINEALPHINEALDAMPF